MPLSASGLLQVLFGVGAVKAKNEGAIVKNRINKLFFLFKSEHPCEWCSVSVEFETLFLYS